MTRIAEAAASVGLVDHHCHGLWRGELTRPEFELLATESDWPEPPGMTIFDGPFGIAMRAEVAPALGLPRHCTADDFWNRRAELGQAGVSELLMPRSGIDTLVIDTGFRGGTILGLVEMAEVTRARQAEIVRLEPVAESLVGHTTATTFAEDFRAELAQRGAAAVGFKSIMAYRFGLDFDPEPPTQAEVAVAAGEWLARTDPESPRLDHPVLLRFTLWAAVEHRKPVQFHVGYGDSDIRLHRTDPSQMTDFIRMTVDTGIQIMLLHCYPYIREAGILAQVFPHVWFDTGVTLNYTGPSGATMIRHSLEMAPMGKILFSSDAFGLPELYYCGTLLWRRHVAAVLDEWVADDRMGQTDALRYLDWMAQGNARRAYRLGTPA